MNYLNSDGVRVRSQIPKNVAEVYRGDAVQDDFLPKMIGPGRGAEESCDIPISACCKLLSMRSIQKNNWRFVSEKAVISEDFYSIIELCADVETVCILPYAYYNYFWNDQSVSRSYRKDRFDKLCEFNEEIKKLCAKLGYSQQVEYRMGKVYCGSVIAVLKQEVACDKSFAEKRKAIETILSNRELQATLEEIKHDKAGVQQKLLFWAMRRRWTGFCYALLVAKRLIK